MNAAQYSVAGILFFSLAACTLGPDKNTQPTPPVDDHQIIAQISVQYEGFSTETINTINLGSSQNSPGGIGDVSLNNHGLKFFEETSKGFFGPSTAYMYGYDGTDKVYNATGDNTWRVTGRGDLKEFTYTHTGGLPSIDFPLTIYVSKGFEMVFHAQIL
jgi:hypothetical protein